MHQDQDKLQKGKNNKIQPLVNTGEKKNSWPRNSNLQSLIESVTEVKLSASHSINSSHIKNSVYKVPGSGSGIGWADGSLYSFLPHVFHSHCFSFYSLLTISQTGKDGTKVLPPALLSPTRISSSPLSTPPVISTVLATLSFFMSVFFYCREYFGFPNLENKHKNDELRALHLTMIRKFIFVQKT